MMDEADYLKAELRRCRPGFDGPSASSEIIPGDYNVTRTRLVRDLRKCLRIAFNGAAAPSGVVAEIASGWGCPMSRWTVERHRARVSVALLRGIQEYVEREIEKASGVEGAVFCFTMRYDETPLRVGYQDQDGSGRQHAPIMNVVERAAFGPVAAHESLEYEKSRNRESTPAITPPYLTPSTTASDIYAGLRTHSMLRHADRALRQGIVTIIGTCGDSASSNVIVAQKIARDMQRVGGARALCMHIPCMMHLLHLIAKEAMTRACVDVAGLLRVTNHLQLGKNTTRLAREFSAHVHALVLPDQVDLLCRIACGIAETERAPQGRARRKLQSMRLAAQACFGEDGSDSMPVLAEDKVLHLASAVVMSSRIPRASPTRWTDMAGAARWRLPLFVFGDASQAMVRALEKHNIQTPEDILRTEEGGRERAEAERSRRRRAMITYAGSDAFLADNLLLADMPHAHLLHQLLSWRSGLFGLRRAVRDAERGAAQTLRGKGDAANLLRQIWMAGARGQMDWGAYEGKRRTLLITVACGLRQRFEFLDDWPYRLLDIVEVENAGHATAAMTCEEFLSVREAELGDQGARWRAFVHHRVPGPEDDIFRARADYMLGAEFRAILTRWAREMPITVVESEVRHARLRRNQLKYGRPKNFGRSALHQALMDGRRYHFCAFADSASRNAEEAFRDGMRKTKAVRTEATASQRPATRFTSWNIFQREHQGMRAVEISRAWKELSPDAQAGYKERAATASTEQKNSRANLDAARADTERRFAGPWGIGDAEYPIAPRFLASLDIRAKHFREPTARGAWIMRDVAQELRIRSTMPASVEWTEEEAADIPASTSMLPAAQVSDGARDLFLWARTRFPRVAMGPVGTGKNKQRRACYNTDCVLLWHADGVEGAFEIVLDVRQRHRIIGCPLRRKGAINGGRRWFFAFDADGRLVCGDMEAAFEEILYGKPGGTAERRGARAAPQWPEALYFAFVPKDTLAPESLALWGLVLPDGEARQQIDWIRYRADWQADARAAARAAARGPHLQRTRDPWFDDMEETSDSEHGADEPAGASAQAEGAESQVHPRGGAGQHRRADRRYRKLLGAAANDAIQESLAVEAAKAAGLEGPAELHSADTRARKAGGAKAIKRRKVEHSPFETCDKPIEEAPWYRPPPKKFFSLRYNAADHRYTARWAPTYNRTAARGTLQGSKTHAIATYGDSAYIAGSLCFLWMWNALAEEIGVDAAEVAFRPHGAWDGLLARTQKCIEEENPRNRECIASSVKYYQVLRRQIYTANITSGETLDDGAELSGGTSEDDCAGQSAQSSMEEADDDTEKETLEDSEDEGDGDPADIIMGDSSEDTGMGANLDSPSAMEYRE